MRLEGVLLTLNLDGFGNGFNLSLQLVLQLGKGHPKHGLQVANKPVHVSLPWHLVDDVLVIIVPQSTTQFLVVHLRLVLSCPPATGNLLGVNQFELPLSPGPGNAVLAVAIGQELQEELPQLYGPGASGVCRSYLRSWTGTGGGVGTVHWGVERRSTGGRNGGAGRGGVWGGAIREGGGASGTVVRVRWGEEESTIGSVRKRIGSEVAL